MALETIDIINGILIIFILTISLYVGLRIISVYFKNKEKVYLFSGLLLIGIVSPWFPHTTSFILVLTTGKGLAAELYFTIGIIFIPVAIICWLYAFTELCYKELQKIILVIYSIYAVLFYILFFIALFTNPILIGELEGDIEVKYSRIVVLYYLTILLTLLITGLIFAIKSAKFENPETKLRGKLLVVAFFSYVIGIGVDAILTHNFFTLIFVRALEMSSVIEFYAAFIMPDWVKKIFLKEK